VQRADANAVAAEDELPCARVPQREGILTVQPLETGDAKLFVQVNERLAVRVGAEAVTLRFEQLAQRDVVVDLAIGDDTDRLVLVVEGLLAAFHVDDREPRVAQAGQTIHKGAEVFWAAMSQREGHAPQGLLIRRSVTPASDSTQRRSPLVLTSATHLRRSATVCAAHEITRRPLLLPYYQI
jgi:hypothetical protein